MTANERIEALLNRAGQTISDLPEEYSHTRKRAVMTRHSASYYSMANKILHLEDVIERMAQALNTACNQRDALNRVGHE